MATDRMWECRWKWTDGEVVRTAKWPPKQAIKLARWLEEKNVDGVELWDAQENRLLDEVEVRVVEAGYVNPEALK